MAIKMIFDPAHNVQSPTMVLTYKSGKSIGAILPQSLHFADSLNSHNEFSFDVHKSVDGIECKHWSKITDFKLVYCVEWDAYFEIYVEIDESNETIKHILGRALSEAELAQVKLYGLEVNTELDISRDDYEPTIIYNSEKEDISLLHKLLEKMPNFIIGHVDASIARLQRTFTFDDKTIYDAFQEISEEVNCLFEFIAKKGENGQIERIINVYDLTSFCNECGCREIESDICPNYASNPTGHSDYNGTDIRHGFGEDTSIFISTRNLADNITYTSDADSVKNCFKLTAGDDLMTATVRNCSPSKSGYLWHFTEDIRADMSDELRDKLNGYESYSQYCRDEYPIFDNNMSYMWSGALTNYNSVVNKYSPYVDNSYSGLTGDEKGYSTLMKIYYDTIDLELLLKSKLMPKADLEDTDADKQAALLRSSLTGISIAVLDHENMSSVSAGNAVENMARIFVDSRYRVETVTKSYDKSSGLWSGDFTITRYTNEEDKAEIKSISITIASDYTEYTKQKIEKKLYKETEESAGVVALFNLEETTDDEFKEEIKKYCLNSLVSFRDACQACLDMMIELGIANKNAQTEDSLSYIQGAAELYENLYKPYWNRRNWIDEEINIRNTEINQVTGYYNVNGQLIKYGMMTYLEWVINAIQSNLDLEDYMREGKTEAEALNLLSELASFRREDTYKNENFVSDGFDNAEIFSRALEFIEEAEKDIKAAAVPVHTISSTLKNLLVMKEFAPIVNYFKVGNWIRVEIDEQIYKLRLIKYEINFDDLNNISVEFSDVQAVKDSAADIQSILNQATTITSNYNNIKIVANQNKKTGEYVWEWVNEGLSLTKMKIIDSAENQNISWDENGFLCREYSPITDAYDNKQLKIINKGLYVTDDNWLTSKAGIGNFIYYDPQDKAYKEGYGVIADTLVGNLILSKEVGIYNENNSVQIDKDGFVITTKSGNDTVFKIQKETNDENGNSGFDPLLYVDDDGNLHIKGNVNATSLTLGENVDLSDNVNLDGYITSDDLNEYATITYCEKTYLDSSEKDTIKSEILSSVAQSYISNSDTSIARVADVVVRGERYGVYQIGGGKNYFTVSDDGLLEAHNAVIYGKIYASAGEFAGELKAATGTFRGELSAATGSFTGSLNSGYTNGGYNFLADDNGVYIGRLSNGFYSMTVDTNGKITFSSGVSLSWDNLPGDVAKSSDIPTNTSDLYNDSGFAYTNNIPSDTDIANISQTTITKDYIETLNIKAGSVSSDWVYAGRLNGVYGTLSGNLTLNNGGCSIELIPDDEYGTCIYITSDIETNWYTKLYPTTISSKEVVGKYLQCQAYTDEGAVDDGSTYNVGYNIYTLNNEISDIKESINNISITNILKSIYPIGSIYINAGDNTNPEDLLGFGTWVAWGAGRVPVGYNSSDLDFNSAEKTGGEKTHTLTVSEMPSHNHNINVKILAGQYDVTGDTYGRIASSGSNNSNVATSESVGGNAAHNNMPPYITCYMWKRTA